MVSGGFLDTVWLVLDIAKTVLKKELSYHYTQMSLIRPRLIDLGVSGRCLKGVWIPNFGRCLVKSVWRDIMPKQLMKLQRSSVLFWGV